MNYDMEQAVKFCTSALEAVMRGNAAFICPVCGKVAHAERVQARLRARCEGCGERIEE